MGTSLTMVHRGRTTSDEGAAVVRVVMAVTAASAAMLGLLQVVDETPPVVLAPALLLLVTLARGNRPVDAWAAGAVWAVMLPLAAGIAILAPILMLAICVAIAVGPERIIEWIRGDWSGRASTPPARTGWIEEDDAPASRRP
jgi:hypothetical protein